MTNKKQSLTDAQKKIITKMREYGYMLMYDKNFQYWEFMKEGKSISHNISTKTAAALVQYESLFEIFRNTIGCTIYTLSFAGKTIDLT